MLSAPQNHVSDTFEPLHIGGLGLAAVALLIGLASRNADWVDVGVSLMLVLPPLRLATTIVGEARAKRLAVAAMGVLVLTFILVSRRIS